MKFLATILISLGFLFLGFSTLLLWQRYNPNRLSFNNYHPRPYSSSTKVYPTRIRIVELNVDLPVIPAEYKNGTWESSAEGVSFLRNSPTPGSEGNSIIYGHNWSNLLGPLHNAEVGQTIEVFLSDKSRVYFKITALGIVSPDNTDILKNTGETRLTIYTCTGFLDNKRLVVAAIIK